MGAVAPLEVVILTFAFLIGADYIIEAPCGSVFAEVKFVKDGVCMSNGTTEPNK
jgi:hypothetical protein